MFHVSFAHRKSAFGFKGCLLRLVQEPDSITVNWNVSYNMGKMTLVLRPLTVTTHGLHAISNHWQLDCFSNSWLFISVSLCGAVHWWVVDSSHKRPVMQKSIYNIWHIFPHIFPQTNVEQICSFEFLKMAAISQTIFSGAFSGMKIYEFRLRFHWSLFLRFELTIFQHWFR